jgi:hypothetical protein
MFRADAPTIHLKNRRTFTLFTSERVTPFSGQMEPLFTKWQWKNLDVKRFLQVPGYPCSLFGAKACSLGQKLLTLRVIYYVRPDGK